MELHNLDIEKAVLGAMMADKDAIVEATAILKKGDFFDARNQRVFEAISRLFDRGEPTDTITVVAETEKLGKAIEKSYLAEILSEMPQLSHVKAHAQLLKELSTKRKLVKYGEKVAELGQSRDDVTTIVDKVERALFEIATDSVEKEEVTLKSLLERAYERAEKKDEDNPYLGIPSGFKDLDAYLGGFQNGDLIVLAARPSVGKTALATRFALNAAKIGKKVFFVSLEMSADQITDRMIGMTAKVPVWNLRNNKLKKEELDRVVDAMGILGDMDVLIHDKPGQSIAEVRTRARRVAMESGVDMIVVDYLQLMHGTYRDNRVLEVSEISQGLKNIARELNVPVIALSQLNRSIENRINRRPQLSDLRESGSIEQDADVVMFIDREEMYNPETERKGLADIVIAKHRNGATGQVTLKYFPKIVDFGDFINVTEEFKNL